MFRRSKEAAVVEEAQGRFRSQTIQSTLSSPAKHGQKVEAALNEGTGKGWTLMHVTSAPVSTTSVFTILFWDTEGDA